MYMHRIKARTTTYTKILSTFLVGLYLIISAPLSVLAAETNILHAHQLSPPASEQLRVNDTLKIYIGAYSSVDRTSTTATGSVTYPQDMLQVVSTDTSSSDFSNLQVNIGQNDISFNATRSPSPGGLAQIFLITFKAKKSGSATVGFSSTSKLNNSSTTYSSSTSTIVDPTPSQPNNSTTTAPSTTSAPAPNSPSSPSSPSQTTVQPRTQQNQSSTSKSSTPQSNTSNTSNIPIADTSTLSEYVSPTVDTTGLIDSVTIDPQYTSSTITWKVNADSPAVRIDYGLSSAKLEKSTVVDNKGDRAYSASLADLNPGVRYYFTITASGGDKTNSTYSGVLITRGYPVTLTVNENNQPVETAQIKIGNQTYTVGSTGKKTIGLAAGRYSITVTTNSASLVKEIVVLAKTIPKDGSSPENQNFDFSLSSSLLSGVPGSSQSVLGFIAVMIVGAVIIGLIVAFIIAYRRRKFENDGSSSYGSGGSNIVIDDGYNWRDQEK